MVRPRALTRPPTWGAGPSCGVQPDGLKRKAQLTPKPPSPGRLSLTAPLGTPAPNFLLLPDGESYKTPSSPKPRSSRPWRVRSVSSRLGPFSTPAAAEPDGTRPRPVPKSSPVEAAGPTSDDAGQRRPRRSATPPDHRRPGAVPDGRPPQSPTAPPPGPTRLGECRAAGCRGGDSPRPLTVAGSPRPPAAAVISRRVLHFLRA
jgi:hypothetical protein